MDFTATLNQISSFSLEDRILLVQAIWDSVAEDESYLAPTEEQKQELDRRVEAYEQAPDDVMTWQGIVGFQRTKTSK
ncbi:MAG: addiction module protein [Cyanobacteria bacterium J06634_6]